jgi:hypothetical protein
VTFTNLGGGAGTTPFVWSDNGIAGINDWVLYDNFTFTVLTANRTELAFD